MTLQWDKDKIDNIVADVRAMIEETGGCHSEQLFCHWIPAQNLLRIKLVCRKLENEELLQSILPRSCMFFKSTMTSFTTEYDFHIVVSNYWRGKR